MRNNMLKRMLSVLLVLCIVAAWILPSTARAAGIQFNQVSNDRVSANLFGKDAVNPNGNQHMYAPTDIVRVSIFLESAGVLDAGYSVQDLAQNISAMAYRDQLEKEQTSVIHKIEKATQEELDVVWNLTLATNLISANVPYGKIEAISKVAGVDRVVVEIQYQPDVTTSAPADPNMATSGVQTGTAGSYAAGYTGAGSRVAIIDTGLDIDHLSFDASAFNYSLSLLAEKAGLSVEEYTASLDLLDAEEIAAVLSELNVMDRVQIDAESMYFSSKIPFGFNYVDGNTNVTHLYDAQGEHGSHVAGIATSNAYIPNEDGTFSSALETVHVQGVAPDAQVLVMKVFGANGGAYQADYMAAIEDAILLGADSVNLSLGSGNPGMSQDANAEYQAIFDNLEKCGVVVSISAGNAGAWMDAAQNGVPYLYLDDVSMHTSGTPGTFTNSLGVASVDNAGYVSTYVIVNDQIVPYMEMFEADGVVFGNAPFTTLAGEQEFVFLNSIGTEEEFAALGEEVLAGKIALCYRGTTSFFEKANAAVKYGAIGVIVVNNVDEPIYLNLTGYEYTAPVVSMTLSDGEAFKLNPVNDENETTLYWTGTMDVAEASEAFLYNSEYYTMSSFSSWGVPGSLILKPEITAPGGAILSVAGANQASGLFNHTSYELMSGTSMAAPQVAGMAALVAQYIRENNLTELTSLDARTLAQSLLMSTAVPLINGESVTYYPVMQQGAGMANVGAAIAADSYILMNADATESFADGKVKVELGDDPDQVGVYTFSFTINNLTDSEKTFALYADFFTQSAFAYGNALYLDTWTMPLYPVVTFTVNGESLEGGADMFGMDFNGDGYVNSADGQILLDYATGTVTEIANAEAADLDANGSVTSYDSYLFFKMLGESGAVVAANGSATVEVSVALSDADKQWLANYENGAYLEGYVFAQSVVDDEGVQGTTHSIPVLGFFGNWSDPSMFDKGSYEEYQLSGEEYRAPYIYQTNMVANGYVNGLYVTYGDDPNNKYYFGGNPIVLDEVYMPERNAISTANGDFISTIGFTNIRNAGASLYQVVDLTTGEVLTQEALGAVSSAYFHVNQQVWKNTYWTLNTGMNPADFLEETMLEMGITLVPEYYVDAEGNVAWDQLGDGVTLSMTVTVDNTAPVLNDVAHSMMNNTLNVDVTDNQYVAAVVLLDSYGEYVYVLEGSQADAVAGEASQYSLDLTGVAGNGFLLQVYDYAMNCTTYEIDVQIGELVDTVEYVTISKESLILQKGSTDSLSASVFPVNASNRDVVWSSTDENVVTVDENGNILAVGEGFAQVVATSVLDETVSAACSVQVIDIALDLNAIVWDEEGSIWYSTFNTANLPEYTKLSGDLLEVDYLSTACVSPDGTIYASSHNTSTNTGSLYTIDPVTYEVTKLSDCMVQGLHIFFSDIAYAPNLYGTGVDALVATYGPYVITLDPATGEYLEIIDQYDEYLLGITVCYGMYSEDYQQSEVAVYAVGRSGTLYQEIYCYLPSYGMTLPYFYYIYGQRAYAETGINMGNAWYFNSLHYDVEKAMVFWSCFNVETDNNVTLYAIDEMNDFAVHNLGKFADSVWPVAGLHQAAAVEVEAQPESFHNMLEALANSKVERNPIELKKIEKETVDIRNEAQSLDNVVVGEREETVTVEITAKDLEGLKVDSTNGVIQVTFNNEALTLNSVLVNGDYISVNQADDSVTFGYVKLDGFAAEDVVATLVFSVLDTTAANFTVTYKEVNDTAAGNSEDVVVEFAHANTEIRDAKDVSCTEDGYTGDVYCVDCGVLVSAGEVIPATGHQHEAVVTEPTCTEQGYTTYTCHCGDTYVDDYVDALGHSHEVTDHKDASCTEAGYDTYTCHCGDTYTEEIPATGHNYVDGVCENCGEVDAENPPTGNANLWSVALAAMTSMVTVVSCIARKREE